MGRDSTINTPSRVMLAAVQQQRAILADDIHKDKKIVHYHREEEQQQRQEEGEVISHWKSLQKTVAIATLTVSEVKPEE